MIQVKLKHQIKPFLLQKSMWNNKIFLQYVSMSRVSKAAERSHSRIVIFCIFGPMQLYFFPSCHVVEVLSHVHYYSEFNLKAKSHCVLKINHSIAHTIQLLEFKKICFLTECYSFTKFYNLLKNWAFSGVLHKLNKKAL